jgi:ribosomal protein S18 acetylase RimI-like enzyme
MTTATAPAPLITIREMQRADLPRLQELSPAEIKNPADFFAFPTLVAEVLHVPDPELCPLDYPAVKVIAGYTQFSLGPDRILHSQAIRIDARFKGFGIGKALCEERVRIAKAAGATFHLYAVDPEGEIALKKIITKQGMHLCRKLPGVWLYAQDLTGDENETV